MKLHNAQKIVKGDKVKYEGQWRDQMRQPAEVRITINKGEAKGDPQVFLEGSAYDTGKVLNALADLAWKNGWRPAGLDSALIMTLAKHEISG
jgi:hypothetical protein